MTTTTTIKATLRAAIFGAALGLVPAVALADSRSERVPDHATAEQDARDTVDTRHETTPRVPDHAEAEEPDARLMTHERQATPVSIPDHATAESGHAERQ
jgi:hypothetical protein